MICPNSKRYEGEPFFIEPTTGREYKLGQCPYQSIQAIFNHCNFWINIHPGNQIADLTLKAFLSNDPMKWETVMPTFKEKVKQKEEGETEAQNNPEHEEEEEEDEDDYGIGMPPSFSPKLNIPDDEFANLNDVQGMSTFYKKTRIDTYADYKQPDGMIYRKTVYRDYRRYLIEEIICIYAFREDKLVIRRKFPFQYKVVEQYSPGKYIVANNAEDKVDSGKIESHLYTLEEVRGISKKMLYYPHRTKDGLVERIEAVHSKESPSGQIKILGGKMVENYKDRYDRIVNRSVTFVTGAKNSSNSFEACNIGPSIFKKITVKYSFNIEEKEKEQIAKIVFNKNATNDIDIYYHINERSITRKSKRIQAEIKTNYEKAAEGKTKEKFSEIREQQFVMQLEKDMTQGIKNQESDQSKECAAREKEKVTLEKDIFYIAKEKVISSLSSKRESSSKKRSISKKSKKIIWKPSCYKKIRKLRILLQKSLTRNYVAVPLRCSRIGCWRDQTLFIKDLNLNPKNLNLNLMSFKIRASM